MSRSFLVLCIEAPGVDRAATLLEGALPADRFRVVRAKGGAEGLKLAGAGNPDLIVLAAKLPDAPDFSALKSLHKNAVTHSTPVILETEQAAREDVLAAMRLGIVDFMAMPVSPEQARAKVERALAAGEKLRQLRRDAGLAGDAVGIDIAVDRTLITLREGWREAVLKNARSLFPAALLNRIKHGPVVLDLRSLSSLQPAGAPLVAKIAGLFAGRVSVLAGRHFGVLVAHSDLEERANLFLSPEELDAFFENAAPRS